MKTGYYNSKSEKLQKSMVKYLMKNENQLINSYGQTVATNLIEGAQNHYPSIIPKIPFVNTLLYDSLLVLNSRMMALKKAMKDEGIGVEEFVRFQISSLRNQTPTFQIL
jgi:hypothetical protein